jgi:hypothetical protein
MRNDDSYPRVLLVNGEPFTTQSGTGLTLLSLFKGWPSDRLACLYVGDATPVREVCDAYWRLSLNDVPWVRAARAGAGSGPQNGAIPAPVDAPPRSAVLRSGAPRAILRGLRVVARHQQLTEIASFRLPADVLGQIKAFAPQLLYSMLGSNAVMRLLLEIQGHCLVPIVPHMMDDWPSTLYRQSILSPLLRHRMQRGLRSVFVRSPLRLAISEAMAEEYSARFGGTFTSFMNTVEILPRSGEPAGPRAPGSPLQVMYVGGLHLNRWRPLRAIGEALCALRQEGLAAELVVHTQPRFAELASRHLADVGSIRLAGPVDPNAVASIVGAADVLVHVESFDPASRRYARLSLSTKIPECLSAGKPILAYGPRELASIRYLEQTGAAIAVTTPGGYALVAALRALITSLDGRAEMGAKGLAVARQRHEGAAQRERFRGLLAEVARDRAQSGWSGQSRLEKE